MGSRLLVLGWHNVEPTWFFPAPPGAGRRGLAGQPAVLRRFANVVPLETALQALTEGRPLPPRAVALSFDDGYRDSLQAAAPLLERLGLPATFFLVPGLLARTTPPWWELLGWACQRAGRSQVDFEGRTIDLGDPARRAAAAATVAELPSGGTGPPRRPPSASSSPAASRSAPPTATLCSWTGTRPRRWSPGGSPSARTPCTTPSSPSRRRPSRRPSSSCPPPAPGAARGPGRRARLPERQAADYDHTTVAAPPGPGMAMPSPFSPAGTARPRRTTRSAGSPAAGARPGRARDHTVDPLRRRWRR